MWDSKIIQKSLFILSILLVFGKSDAFAQFGTPDCGEASVICNTNQTIREVIPTNYDRGENIIRSLGTCINKHEFVPFWYKFTAASSGSFEMQITPFGGTYDNDWDFVLFESNNGCNLNASNVVACNFSPDCTPTGISSVNASNWTPQCDNINPWVPAIQLDSGKTYILFIDGFEVNPAGFTLEFNMNNLPDAATFLDVKADFSADRNTICAGETISFTNHSSFPSGSSFSWSFGDGTTASTQHTSHTFDAPGTYDVILNVYNSSCGDADTMLQIEVVERPIPDFSFTGLCIGDTIEFTGNSSGNPDSYSWNFGTNASPSTATGAGPHKVVFSSSGPQSVTFSVDNLICSVDTTKTVTINPLPVINSTATPPTICEGESTVLSVSGTDSYQWYDLTTGQLLGTISDITITPGSSTRYVVIAEDASGCTNSDTIDITVNPVPTASVSADKDTLCAGEDITISVAFNAPFVPAATNAYSFDNGATFGNSNTWTIPAVNSDTIVSIVVRDESGCTSDTIDWEISVRPELIPAFSVSNACLGSPITVTNTSTGNPTSFIWAFAPDADIPAASTEGPHNILFATAGTKTISLTISNVHCGPETHTSSIEIEPLLPVTATATDNTICEGESVTISASGADSYQWRNLTTGQTIGTGTAINVTPDASTQYVLTGSDASGCSNSDTIDITVNPIPTASGSANKDTLCAGENITISVAFNVPFVPAANAYSFDNGSTFGSSNTWTIPAVNSDTTVSIVVRDENGCTSDIIDWEISVRPELIPAFSVSNACLGSPITVTNMSSGNPTSFSWTFAPDADIPAATTEGPHNILFTTAGTKTIALTISNAHCGPETHTSSIEIEPLLPVTATATDNTICEGESVTISASGADSYQWINLTTGQIIGSSATINVTPNTSTRFVLTGSDASGCSNSDTIDITVNPIPTASVSADKDTICTGDDITISVAFNAPFVPAAANAYSFDNGATFGNSNTWTIPAVNSDTIVSIVVRDENGCTSNVINWEINIRPVLIPDFSVSNACLGSPITVTNMSSGNPTSFSWTFAPDADIPAATTEGPHNILFTTAGTKTIALTISNAHCGPETHTSSIEIEPLLPVTATATDNTICEGESVTISASGADSYQWINLTTGQTIGTNATINVTPNPSTRFVLTGYDAFGCSNSDTIDIIVNPIPTASVSANKDTLCAGENITISVAFNVPFVPAAANAYSFDNGSTFGNSSSWTIPAVNSDTTVSIVVRDENGCTSNVINWEINIRPVLIPDFSVSNACLGSPITVTNTSTGNPTSFLWNFAPDADVPNATTEGPHNILFATAGTKIITLTIDDAHCGPKTLAQNIEISELLPVNATASSNAVCLGESVTLSSSNLDSYQWINLTTGQAIGASATVNISPDASTRYVLIGADAFGCSNSDTVDITVNQIPTASVSADKDTLCIGENIAVSVAFNAPFVPAATNAYSFDNGVTFGNSNSWTIPAVNSDTIVSIVVRDENGCTSDTIDWEISVRPELIPAFSVSNACLGSPITVTNTSTGNPTSFLWAFAPDADVPTASTEGPHNILFATAGTKTITLTIDDAHCGPKILSQNIEISELLPVNATASSNAVCLGETVTLSSNSLNSYQWINLTTGQIIGSSATINVIPNTSTRYVLTGSDAFGCSNSDTIDITVNPIPTASVSANKDTICTGENITISVAFNVPFVPAAANAYSFDNGATFGNTSSWTIPAVNSDTTVSIVVRDENGCTSDTIDWEIKVRPALIPAFSVSNACLGSPITVTNTSSGNPASFSWTFAPDADVPTAVTEGPHNILFATAGTKTISLTISNAHCGPVTMTSVVEISSGNIVTVTADNNTVCEGESVTLTSAGADNYIWYTSPDMTEIGTGSELITNPDAATTYAVVGSSSNGCTDTTTIAIAVLPKPSVEPIAPVTVCYGESATLTVTMTPGSVAAPSNGFSFDGGNSWNTLPTHTVSNITQSTVLSVLVRDVNGCISDTIQAEILLKTLTATITVDQNVLCYDSDEGIVSVSNPGGGAAPYMYSINGGSYSFNPTFSNLIAGTHTIELRDALMCRTSFQITVDQPDSLALAIDSSHSVLCYGQDNGYVMLEASGGVAPYSYSIINNVPQTSPEFSNLRPGNYLFQVEDANNCYYIINTTITEPDTLISALNQVTQVSCFGGSDGSISAIAIGGVSPYSYSTDGIDYISENTLNGVPAGNHTVYVRDQNGCISTFEASVSSPEALQYTIEVLETPSCFVPTGSFRISSVSGGTPSYLFSIDGSPQTTLAYFLNVAMGSHTIEIEDANGCITEIDYFLAGSDELAQADTATSPATCFGDSDGTARLLNVRGGAGPYEFSINNPISYQSSPVFEDLAAGLYTIYIRTAEACVSQYTVEVQQPDPILSSIANWSDSICYGSQSGYITLTTAGGTPAYEYQIDGMPSGSSGYFDNLESGMHVIEVRDSRGCTGSNVAFTISERDAIAADIIELLPDTCNRSIGVALVNDISGGKAPYRFSSDGGNTFQDDYTLTNLSAGIMNIIVQDHAGCQALVPLKIRQVGGIDLDELVINVKHIECNGVNIGEIALSNIVGEHGPYSFAINNEPPRNNPIFTRLRAGNHTITITGQNGCSMYLRDIVITQPMEILYEVNTLDETCQNEDGEIRLFGIKGGVGPYRYSINSRPPVPVDVTGDTITNLTSGEYFIVVTDSKQCTSGKNIIVHNETRPKVYVSVQLNLCGIDSSGIIRVDSVTGGRPSYQYSLNNGLVFQSNPVFDSLTSGHYFLTVQDQLCTYKVKSYFLFNEATTAYDSIPYDTITLNAPLPLHAEASAHDGNSSGTIVLNNIGGGTSPYYTSIDSTEWDMVDGNSATIENLLTGQYTVYLKDLNDCILEFPGLSLNTKFAIPNLFTPNNDGSNETFFITGLPYKSKLLVVNRWGSVVYRSENYDNSWDGSNEEDGVYYYELQLRTGKTYKGWVEIVR